jgi:hypothetical protein
MTEQRHKPGGELDRDGKARPVEDRQAARNQGEAKPEDYPERGLGQTPMPPD